jgi:hypothetical protein
MTTTSAQLDFASLWDMALDYPSFVAASGTHKAMWEGVYRLARIPDWALDGVRPFAGRRHLLVIAEDWCGDASNTVPILARLSDLSGHFDLRILRRDEHPALMDQYLTGESRSIPVVIVLDESFEEVGHWGPRPTVLQDWVTANRAMPKAERYPQMRRWYARDKGETTLREVVEVVSRKS